MTGAALPSAGGRFVRVPYTTLRVDERGPVDGPPVLFVHGGPGQGCADFMACVGDLLARELRVIGVDQRGALYSDALPDDVSLTVDDLVADFEALRLELGIDEWTVLGHSIGGRYALRYALQHPNRVSAAIFENPEWDFVNSTRAQLARALPLLDGRDRQADAERIRELLAGELSRTTAMWQEKRQLLAGLESIYLHDTTTALMDRLPQLDPDARARGQRHAQLLTEDPMLYRSYLADLDQLTQPALLLAGAHDPIANEPVLDAFRRAPRGHLEVFEQSGHFIHLEEPKRYAKAVSAFMTALHPA